MTKAGWDVGEKRPKWCTLDHLINGSSDSTARHSSIQLHALVTCNFAQDQTKHVVVSMARSSDSLVLIFRKYDSLPPYSFCMRDGVWMIRPLLLFQETQANTSNGKGLTERHSKKLAGPHWFDGLSSRKRHKTIGRHRGPCLERVAEVWARQVEAC